MRRRAHATPRIQYTRRQIGRGRQPNLHDRVFELRSGATTIADVGAHSRCRATRATTTDVTPTFTITVCGDNSCGRLLLLDCAFRPQLGIGMQRTDALHGRCFCMANCWSHQLDRSSRRSICGSSPPPTPPTLDDRVRRRRSLPDRRRHRGRPPAVSRRRVAPHGEQLRRCTHGGFLSCHLTPLSFGSDYGRCAGRDAIV